MRSCQILSAVALAVAMSPPAAAQSSRQPSNNPFLGSVLKGTAAAEPLALSVKDVHTRLTVVDNFIDSPTNSRRRNPPGDADQDHRKVSDGVRDAFRQLPEA